MAKKRHAIKAGAAQLPATTLSRASEALELITGAIDEAARQRVDLLVFPEGAYPSYYLPSVEAFRSAGVVENAELLSVLARRAKSHGMHIVCGFVEDRGDRLHNAAAIVDDTGAVAGVARKSFLWGDDNKVFAPGRDLGVFECELGGIGIAICADVRAPETTTALAYRGAEIVAVPTCWVNVAETAGEYYNPQPDFLIEARTREIAVPFVCANKFGTETDHLSYCGCSLITDAQGNVLAKAPPDRAALITAEIQPARARKPELPDWTRDRISSTQPAEVPHVGPEAEIKVAAVPTSQIMPADGRNDVLRFLAADGVQVVASAVESEDVADEMDVYARALGIELVGYPSHSRVMWDAFGSYGALRGTDLLSFAPARALALDGAAVLFVIDPPLASDVESPHDEIAILRARAMENHVYLVAASVRSATIVAPNGAILARSAGRDPQPVVAMIDLQATRNKYVFPHTHIFDQRKPEMYAAAFHPQKVKGPGGPE